MIDTIMPALPAAASRLDCRHSHPDCRATDRIVSEAIALNEMGIGTIAIMPNDTAAYGEDSFDHMKAFAAKHGFSFPYVIDETQEVARAYGAQCTPDFFGFDAARKLKYRGRLDEGRTGAPPKGARRELVEAMRTIAQSGTPPGQQFPAMGCSIKWKAA